MGRRDDGSGGYGVPVVSGDERDCESKYGASMEVLMDVSAVGASLSREVL